MTINTQKLREALELIEYELQASYNNAKPVCCGHGYGECCGNPEPVWDAADQKIMDVLGPIQQMLFDAVSQTDAQTAEIAESQGQIEHLDRRNNALRQSLGSMIHAYVRLLECGRDRILDLGGQCDPLDVLEANDPWLRDARATLQEKSNA